MSKADLAAERKAQIINATIECIARYGYHNFSMQDVARVADVSKGIIHYYFLNKEDLMMAVLDRVSGDIESLLSGTVDQSNNPTERLKTIIQICFNVVKEKKEYYCINIDFWTQINQKDKVRQAVANHYSKFRQSLLVVIEDGIKAGVFKPIDPQQAASMIIAMVDGVSLQWLFDENVIAYEELRRKSEEMILNYLVK